MARRCFQEGCVFKRGRRKKVWVGRWSEYVVDESGGVRRVLKSEVLGPVSELSKGDAKERLRERLRPLFEQDPQHGDGMVVCG